MDRQKVECQIRQFGNWLNCEDFVRKDSDKELMECTYYRSDKNFMNGICLLNEIRLFNSMDKVRLEDELFKI